MLTETVNIHVYNFYLISHLPLNFFENIVNQNVANRRIKPEKNKKNLAS